MLARKLKMLEYWRGIKKRSFDIFFSSKIDATLGKQENVTADESSANEMFNIYW